jgi:N-acetylneuraminic acid mutarotase
MMLDRRAAMLSLTSLAAATSAAAQAPGHEHHGPMFESLRQPGRVEIPAIAASQHVFESPAPKAANPGRWVAKAALPLPRSEMAWATVREGRMHLLGGYGEQRVDRPYHHIYDPDSNAWTEGPPLPIGANHVGVVVVEGRLYAIGGHLEQNRKPHSACFVLEPGAADWRSIAPLPLPAGATGCVDLAGTLHVIGGAIGDTTDTKKSIDWHLVYDAKADRWDTRKPMPTGRDHIGLVAVNGLIHVIGGRVDNFHTNSNLHHTYDPAKDAWTMRRPLPTARSGHGAVLYRGKIFIMGGEGTDRVFGQNEAYDPAADTWEAYAPMKTPRHGLGAVAIGEHIYVAGGGPVMGGGFQSAVHEAFTLA